MTCCCSVTDYDPATFHRAVTRTARKRHVCCECSEAIEPGETYEDVTALWEPCFKGDRPKIQNFKTCRLCLLIRRDYFCDGWLYEGMREMLQECIGFDYVTGPYGDEEED